MSTNQLDLEEVKQFVEENISKFHTKRIESLNKLKLDSVLKRKNPYLFRAKNMMTAEGIIRGITDAHISSNEETIFGDWLEGMAIFINNRVYGGQKSSTTGIDLEFNKENIRYIVTIKSGPNWGNSSQIKKMIADFNTAKRTLKTSNSKLHIIAVNGCCYGRDNKPEKNGDYQKLCGQRFWEFISNNENLYTEIIKPLGFKAKSKNDEFLELYSNVINRFSKKFMDEFCNIEGSINWDKLVKYNSAINPKI